MNEDENELEKKAKEQRCIKQTEEDGNCIGKQCPLYKECYDPVQYNR